MGEGWLGSQINQHTGWQQIEQRARRIKQAARGITHKAHSCVKNKAPPPGLLYSSNSECVTPPASTSISRCSITRKSSASSRWALASHAGGCPSSPPTPAAAAPSCAWASKCAWTWGPRSPRLLRSRVSLDTAQGVWNETKKVDA